MVETAELIRDPQGKWLNSDAFRQPAIHHAKYGYYCEDPWGSPAWETYWQTELGYCNDGREIDNVRITGDHYMYLNYSQIEVAVEVSDDVAEKETKFPDFWDGDYDYFWSLYIARFGVTPTRVTLDENSYPNVEARDLKKLDSEAYHKLQLIELAKLQLTVKPHPDYLNGGHNMIVGKARRKGYSYKNGAICANTYNRRRKSLTVIGAFEKKFLYPRGTMQMASDHLNFLNQETGWAKGREFIDRADHKKASFEETKDGVKVEKGYQSEVMALSFMNNPDSARGKDAYYVLLEEAGAFPNLEDSYKATAPGLRAGRFATGQIIIFGTGGDMESGTADFAKMFFNPEGYNLMPFINIWDEGAENTTCGFFHPFYMNYEGYYDAQGNSDIAACIAMETKEREKIIRGANGNSILQGRVQEYPMCPSEAFLTVSFNDFPIIELRNRLNKVTREGLHIKRSQAVHLYRDSEGKARMRPDLKHELEPIWNYIPKNKNLHGAPVIFEAPIEGAPKGLYKIGYDPYRQVNGTSLAAIYVYKGTHRTSLTRKNNIVAMYVGRPPDPDDVNRIAELFAELYNAEVMHENEVTHVKNYFTRRKKLHLLAAQADEVISANIQNSKVARVYGMHMVDKLKDAGEKYVKQWLLSEVDADEFGNMLTTIDFIDDPGILEELILYSRKGNFDRMMALMQVMFQVEEDELEQVYDSNDKEDVKAMMDDYLNSLYNR